MSKFLSFSDMFKHVQTCLTCLDTSMCIKACSYQTRLDTFRHVCRIVLNRIRVFRTSVDMVVELCKISHCKTLQRINSKSDKSRHVCRIVSNLIRVFKTNLNMVVKLYKNSHCKTLQRINSKSDMSRHVCRIASNCIRVPKTRVDMVVELCSIKISYFL